MVDFLLVTIERVSLSLTAEALQSEIHQSRCFLKGGSFEANVRLKGNVYLSHFTTVLYNMTASRKLVKSVKEH